ncbi:exocyst complex component EXO70B1-like [Phragmites australis]|uniref:exocyst complex component EXO70B1-like n=1 Tax=Phragmites australis TaxID=29695 RepID=UPI002D774352|nr:exocyst complex component EXO70B1-like [Phragmites australis]
MSMAPCRRAAGGLGPRHRSTTGRRHGLIRPREQDFEEILRDARVRGGWLGHAAVSQFPGDMEGCVHGGFAAGDSSRLPMSERIREKASRLQRELDSIERSIVVPICLHREARGFFPDSSRRLDRYLEAAKRLLQLETSGDIDRRKKSLLKTVMSSLAVEFCHLRVWRLDDALMDHSPDSIWESVRRSRSCSGGSDDPAASSWPSSSGSITGTGDGTSDASSYGTYHTGLGEEPSVRSHNTFSGMIYINRRSLSILNDIAGVMIRGGCEHILRQAFDGHCAQLARYIEILDIDNIWGGHTEEPREIRLKVWTSSMRIIIGFLSEMQRQLNQQDFGSFNTLKEDYFSAIAKVSVMKLLNSARSFCIPVGPPIDPSCKDRYAVVKSDLSKIENVVMMYQALNYGMPAILTLFSGKTKEFIVAEGELLINRFSRMFVKLSVELNYLVRSQRLFITDTGVHRATKYIMHHMGLLVQQKNTIHLMLKGDFKAFGELVTQLISSLEFMLDINSRSLQFQGQQQIFVLNNVNFLLEEAGKNSDLGLILGESWFSRCHDQLDQCIEGYLDASWTPVVSSLERRTRFPTMLWPHQLVDKFTSFFEMTYNVQKNWKVTDPLMRQMLREAISQKVIPLYRMHMENYSEKKHKSTRYSIEQLGSQLLELFEG